MVHGGARFGSVTFAKMSTEDSLFRALRSTAEALLRERLARGDSVQVEELSDQVLLQLGEILQLGEHKARLRARLDAFLREQTSKR